jgi:hypothetical protein
MSASNYKYKKSGQGYCQNWYGYRNEIYRISWIVLCKIYSKIIQTKEEQVNLVYTVKVKVKNDGN